MFALSPVGRSIFVCGLCSLMLLLGSSLLFCSSSCKVFLNAQETNTNSENQVLRNSSDGGSLDVALETVPYPATVNSSSMRFELSFLKPNSSQLQEHVDFNFRIYKNDERVYQATNQTGQPLVPLHSTDGTMPVPLVNYQFDQAGEYLIEVPLYGILFNPIRPESANFTINVE